MSELARNRCWNIRSYNAYNTERFERNLSRTLVFWSSFRANILFAIASGEGDLPAWLCSSTLDLVLNTESIQLRKISYSFSVGSTFLLCGANAWFVLACNGDWDLLKLELALILAARSCLFVSWSSSIEFLSKFSRIVWSLVIYFLNSFSTWVLTVSGSLISISLSTSF